MKISRSENWNCKFLTNTVIHDIANSQEEWLARNSDYIHPCDIQDKIEDKCRLVYDKKNYKTKSQKKIDKMIEINDCIVNLRLRNADGNTLCCKVVHKKILNIIL